MSRSLDLPALDKVDTLAQELALLQDKGKRRIAILGSRHVPIVIVTALDSDDCRRRGEQAGADAYFAKPFDIDGLLSTLESLIEESRDNGDAK